MPCPERRLRLHCSYSSHCRPVALPLCLRHGCVRLLPHCSGCWSCTCGASIHGSSARARSSTRCRQSRRSRHGHGMARRALACAQCAMDRRAHGSVRVHVLDHGGHARRHTRDHTHPAVRECSCCRTRDRSFSSRSRRSRSARCPWAPLLSSSSSSTALRTCVDRRTRTDAPTRLCLKQSGESAVAVSIGESRVVLCNRCLGLSPSVVRRRGRSGSSGL